MLQLRPEVVILDLQMPVMDGLEARTITGLAPETAMLMFTSHASAQVLEAAKMAGIREVISKSEHASDHLLDCLQALYGRNSH